jgi:GNAT superfamily N-acetyltransferase
MNAEEIDAREIAFKPVTKDVWNDLKELFGTHGAYSGCWCMWWRLKRSEFEKNTGEGNRKALKKIVDSGTVPGILAYFAGKPIAWCSVAPREQFPVLDRSPVLKRFDNRPVWSIVCFFISKPFRRKGLNRILIQGAIDYAGKNGAKIVESYPVDKETSKNTSIDGFTGFARTFSRVGFKEVIRRSEKRPIFRYYIDS